MRSARVESESQIASIDHNLPLRRRSEQGLKVRILGCSGGIGRGLRTTSILLNHSTLIDIGTGAGELSHTELESVDTLFLTHSHLDHTALLPLLLDTTFEHRVHKPLTVYALPETIDALRTHMFNDVMWPDFELLPNVANPVVQFVSIEPGEAIETNGFTVHVVEAFHAVPAVGYCVESDAGVFAFSGDTMTNESLWPRLNQFGNLDTLLVEVSFPNAMEALARQAGHYTPAMLATDLRKLRHTPRIWITAMKPKFRDEIVDEVLAAIPDRDVRWLKRGDEFSL